MAKLTRTRKLKTVDRLVGESESLGLIMNQAGSGNGAECIVEGLRLKNFGSCSYMGLEKHPTLLAGARAALDEYGTQFSFSRAYLDNPLYQELEEKLERITDRFALVTPSTTLGHLAALPVLVCDHDIVVIDQFAHASLHMATDTLTGTAVERLRHNRMDLLEAKLAAYTGPGKVWFVCDGVYSMLGNFADFDALDALLSRYPALHVYIDDAHAVSWTGRYGRGAALERLGHSERVVVALSLNKAFSAAGGALALPTAELRARIRRCGGPMLFSGPVQPPMLGVAVAAADLHLSEVFPGMQAELAMRIEVAQSAIDRLGLPTAVTARTPIFMTQFDAPPQVHRALNALRARGYYCCLSTFPAVPLDKPSVRFTVSRHNTPEDIVGFIETMADVVGSQRVEDTTPFNVAV